MRLQRTAVRGSAFHTLASLGHKVTVHVNKSSMVISAKAKRLLSFLSWWETRAAGTMTGCYQQG